MPLKLYVSNSLTALSSRLCTSLQSRNYTVFQPFTIVTQTEGMSNWLTLEIAKKIGIAAHLQYKKPGAIIQQVYRILGGSSSEVLSQQHMDWLIDQVLSSAEFQHIFKDKAAYFQEDPVTETLKRMSLARRLADLFDQYQIYRSQIIRQWTERPWNEAEPAFQWQAYIWQSLKKIASDAIPDMTHLSHYILDALKEPVKVKKLQQSLPEINLFGLSIITQFHIRIFYELAEHIDLNFYLLNPAPDIYWIEDRSEKEVIRLMAKYQSNSDMLPTEGNALLTNWGKVLQHTFGMLYQTETFINQQEEVAVHPPGRQTLLQKIQDDIFHNLTETSELLPHDLEDGSIVIQSNYSRPREVQSLYNYLIDLIHHRKEEGLSANDILVMVHPIEEYAPYIRAIFEHAPVALPFHIADEPATEGNTPLSSLVALLEINETNFTAENVLQLLEWESIRNHYGIYDLQHIRDSVQLANIRFGMENEVYDDSYTVSWMNGINRMMYGLCISGERAFSTKDTPSFYCLDNTEGTEKMHQVIRFCSWVNSLMKTIKERSRKRSLEEWIAYTITLMEQFIEFNTDDDTYFRTIERQLKHYEAIAALISTELDFETFSRHLTSHLQQEQHSKVFSSGGITFCSQIPMRSIPFKIIAMLGLGLNDFPRKSTGLDFDMMRYKPQLGDRNIKDNDRHLFLETLLSAQSRLYLSFVGRSVKDNSLIPPSVLVDELLDYIQQGINRHTRENNQPTIDMRHRMIVQQPLHNFSSRYNKQERSLINYLLYREQQEAWAKKKEDLHIATTVNASLSVNDFVTFCTNPIKYYYQKELKIFLKDEKLIIPDTEMFNLDSLDKNQLQKQLVQAFLQEETMDEVRDRLLKKGKLPLKNMSIVAAIQEEKKATTLYQRLCEVVTPSQQEPFKVEVQLSGVQISGNLDNVFNGQYVYINFTGKEKNLIEAYVRFLLGRASGLQGAYIISETETFRFSPITPTEAWERLNSIAELLQEKMKLPIFFGKDLIMKEEAIEFLNDEDLLQFIQKAIEGFHPTCYDPYIIDAYHHRMMDRDGVSDDYLTLYKLLFAAAKNSIPQN